MAQAMGASTNLGFGLPLSNTGFANTGIPNSIVGANQGVGLGSMGLGPSLGFGIGLPNQIPFDSQGSPFPIYSSLFY